MSSLSPVIVNSISLLHLSNKSELFGFPEGLMLVETCPLFEDPDLMGGSSNSYLPSLTYVPVCLCLNHHRWFSINSCNVTDLLFVSSQYRLSCLKMMFKESPLPKNKDIQSRLCISFCCQKKKVWNFLLFCFAFSCVFIAFSCKYLLHSQVKCQTKIADIIQKGFTQNKVLSFLESPLHFSGELLWISFRLQRGEQFVLSSTSRIY